MTPTSPGPIGNWGWIIAVIPVIAFQHLFFIEPLYNSDPNPANRLTRLNLIELLVAPADANLVGKTLKQFSTFEYLPQRVPIAGYAGLIIVVAVLLGRSLLAWLSRERFAGMDALLYSYAIGMAAVALLTLGLGLIGRLSADDWWLGIGFMSTFAWLGAWWRRVTPTTGHQTDLIVEEPTDPLVMLIVSVAVLPFLILSLLAAMLPTTDFDALNYHLLGPKEWFLAGRVEFLPHNVYTTFPFLTEMHHLTGMVLTDDWPLGGLVGQTVLWSFGLMTGLAVGRLASRLFGNTAGWLALFVYLTVPWTYRLSMIPYVEGALLFYTVLALDALHRVRDSGSRDDVRLVGVLCGSAVACKYPGLVTTTIPLLVLLLLMDRPGWRAVLGHFTLGWLLAIGPWLVRNILWTGDPVFPLGYSIFGSPHWSAALADKFHAGHHAIDFSVASIERYLIEIPLRSDWQSALVFAFAPFAFFTRRRPALLLLVVVTHHFLTFWGLTHRLDRFWLVLEPLVCILAGAGMVAWSRALTWKVVVILSALSAWVLNLAFCTTGLCGLNLYLADLSALRATNAVKFSPPLALAGQLDPKWKILYVGWSAVYESTQRVAYNTVFNVDRLEQMTRSETGEGLLAADRIRENFVVADLDAIIVDWAALDRYRSPGNYGYTDFITHDLFDQFQRLGLLERLSPPGPQEAFRIKH